MNDNNSSAGFSVSAFRSRAMWVPNPGEESGSCAQFYGTSSGTGTLMVDVPGYDARALNVMFALMTAAFSRPDIQRADIVGTSESNDMLTYAIGATLPPPQTTFASDAASAQPMAAPPRRDSSNSGYVKSITVAPGNATDNALITLEDAGGTELQPTYLLNGASNHMAITTMLEVLLYARVTHVSVTLGTSKSPQQQWYIDDVYCIPYDERAS